jgi:hypothetical protein
MKISRLILNTFILLITTGSILAQYEYPGTDENENNPKHKKEGKSHGLNEESRIFFGGNLGLSFGSYTYIELAPTIGYKITQRFWSGIGPEYLYFKWKSIDYHTSIYGFRNFASFAVLKDINKVINVNIGSIFLYAENEVLNLQPYYLDNRNWYDILLGGFGIRMPIGNRSGISILVLFGLTDSASLLYTNPEIRLNVDI